MSLKKVFIDNIIFAFVAQTVSIIVSLIMTLGIPKILSVEEYGFWQLFIFYTGFIGFFLFGLSDGIYLKYGGKKFDELNKQIIKSQMVYGFFLQLLISLVIIVVGSFLNIEWERHIIIFATALYLVLGNLVTLLGFLLLATNNIKYYSKAILVDKISFIIILTVIFLYSKVSYMVLIELFIVTKLLSLVYLLSYFRNYKNLSICSFKRSFSILKINMSVGIILMLSNIASTLIIGIGRFAIDNKWDIETFGKISLSLSATYFFLLLISQVSLALFPVLRQLDYVNQRNIFTKSCELLGIIMLGVFLLYFPLISFLEAWLPKYADSLKYLVILMPICLFEGKMQMIHNTYMKSLNKQEMLLLINIAVLIVSLILTYFAAYNIHNLMLVVYVMLFCISLRSIFTQLYLYRFYNLKFDPQILMEILFTIIFISVVTFFKNLPALIMYVGIYLLFLLIFRKKFTNILKFFFFKKKVLATP